MSTVPITTWGSFSWKRKSIRFLIYPQIVVEYSFSRNAGSVGDAMDAEGMVSELTPKIIDKSKKISQAIDIIIDRDFSYLRRGLSQPGGKLPLFDLDGQAFEAAVIRRCIARGWAEPWFSNPLKPDWLVCKLTAAGRVAVERALDLRTQPPTRAAS